MIFISNGRNGVSKNAGDERGCTNVSFFQKTRAHEKEWNASLLYLSQGVEETINSISELKIEVINNK